MTTEIPVKARVPMPQPSRRFRLFQRRTVYLPTLTGWGLIVAVLLAPFVYWFFRGEKLLSLTDRKQADILVVEGWMHELALFAAAREFETGGYKFIIATGEYTAEAGSPYRWSYSDIAEKTLRRAGVPADKIIRVPAEYVNNRRTFTTASIVRRYLEEQLHKKEATLNVFAFGAHARRSRLVYKKALGDHFTVGVVSWRPAEDFLTPWWKSSERAKDLLVETFGWFFELLFNSGRVG
ncbi:MAG: hypothetical protein QM790_06990 [Nibricoccus sp.]